MFVFSFFFEHFRYFQLLFDMIFAKRMKELREQRELNRTEIAELIGVSHVMIGRYERNETVPSIEVAKKIADALNVSLDYLAGNSIQPVFDKEIIKRIQDIEELSTDNQEKLFFLIDNITQNIKAKRVYDK